MELSADDIEFVYQRLAFLKILSLFLLFFLLFSHNFHLFLVSISLLLYFSCVFIFPGRHYSSSCCPVNNYLILSFWLIIYKILRLKTGRKNNGCCPPPKLKPFFPFWFCWKYCEMIMQWWDSKLLHCYIFLLHMIVALVSHFMLLLV